MPPVVAGRFTVHGSHDRDKRRSGDMAIEIEAGLAFGTGHHGTTAGCLEMLERIVARERPRNALDLGTGSAVLAIALAKLAHIPVLATDIDPVAVKVARDNARLNGVSAFVEARTATGFHHPAFAQRGPFDLIVANSRYRADVEESQIRTLLERRPDAIVLTGLTHTPEARQLLRSAGIPAVWVKTMDVEWIWDFKKKRPFGSWSGHVFLEIYLDGKWVLLDPGASRIYVDYSPHSRILPGNRFAYHKGSDPRQMVM